MFCRHIFLGIFCLISSSAVASPPSGLTWYTLQSEHFHVHFTANQESYARAFTVALESALPKLEKDLGWKAPSAIDIVINDAADNANGEAISFPNTHIEVFAVPFESNSVLMDYHNWVQELATHELTHIIANDSAFGAYQTLRSIFGSWVKPNGLQPSWLIEGLAVNEETKQTPGGRGRSVFVDAFFRTAAQEHLLGRIYTVDRFNDGPDWWWPAGNSAYLLGYAAQAGFHPGKISEENAHTLPYSLNSVMENVAGKDWETAWGETVQKISTRYGSEQKTDKENPAICQLTHSGRFTGGLALSDDALYFSMEDSEEGYALAKLPFNADCINHEPKLLVEKNFPSPPHVSISSDKKKLLFTNSDFSRTTTFINDIFLYDLEKETSKQITKGGRLFDPSFLGDGKEFVAIRHLANTVEALEILSLDGKTVRQIYRTQPFERLGQPIALGEEIFFSKHNNAGQEEIFVFNQKDHSVKAAITGLDKGTHFTERDAFPVDKQLIYVANYPSRTNHSSFAVFTFHRDTKKLEKLAESASGMLLHPMLRGKTLFASAYTDQGMNLVKIDLDKNPGASPTPAINQDLHEALNGEQNPEQTSAKTSVLSSTKPYSAFSSPATTMWPQYWMPTGVLAYNGALLGASTSGNDALDYQNYSLTAYYDTRSNFPTYIADYTNRNYLVDFSVSANQYNNYFTSSSSSNRVAVYSANGTYSISSNLSTSLGAAYQERTLFGSKANGSFLFDYLSYNNVHAYPSAITPNRGMAANLYLGLYPKTGNENSFADLRPSLAFYQPGFATSHSVSARANFAVTTNRFLATNYFLGGGASALSDSSYIVRGYPQDALLGQKIATLNLAYTMPISRPYSGLDTNPFFFKDIGLRFLFDGGASTYLSRYDTNSNFLYYDKKPFGTEVIFGSGVDLISESKLFYYLPVEVSLGVHRGLQTQYGGETILYLGVVLGSLSGNGSIPSHH